MLILDGAYTPRVVAAGHFRQSRRRRGGTRTSRASSLYTLHVFRGGELHIGDRHDPLIIRDQGVALIPPGEAVDLRFIKMEELWFINFLVRHEPEWPEHNFHRNYAVTAPGRMHFLQPGPEDVWGIDMPTGMVVSQMRMLEDAATRIALACEFYRPDEMVEAHLFLTEIIATLVRQQRLTPQRQRQDVLLRARRYAETHIGQGLTVHLLAKHAGMERAAFTRLFAEYFSISPGSYLRYLRLANGLRLLVLYPDLDIGIIAQRLGFADHAGFTRSFRSALGCSPGVYRRRRLMSRPGRRYDVAVAQRKILTYGKQLRKRLGLPTGLTPLYPAIDFPDQGYDGN